MSVARVDMSAALTPTTTLVAIDDPSGIGAARRRSAEHARAAGTVVFSTHHLAEARRADRVLLLAGEVVADRRCWVPPERRRVGLVLAVVGDDVSH